MEVVFKESNRVFYKVILVDGDKYLLDLTTVIPKLFFWQFKTQIITVSMIKLEEKDSSFEGLVKTVDKSFGPALGVVISGILYSLMDDIFLKYNISQNFSLKIFLLAFSVLLSFIVFKVIVVAIRYNVNRRIPDKSTHHRITFKVLTQKSHINLYKTLPFIVGIYLIIFCMYMLTNNGTEGGFLIINSIVTLGIFTLFLGMLPLRESFEKNEILFEAIEEL